MTLSTHQNTAGRYEVIITSRRNGNEARFLILSTRCEEAKNEALERFVTPTALVLYTAVLTRIDADWSFILWR